MDGLVWTDVPLLSLMMFQVKYGFLEVGFEPFSRRGFEQELLWFAVEQMVVCSYSFVRFWKNGYVKWC